MKLKNKTHTETHVVQLRVTPPTEIIRDFEPAARYRTNVEAAAARNFAAVRDAHRAPKAI